MVRRANDPTKTRTANWPRTTHTRLTPLKVPPSDGTLHAPERRCIQRELPFKVYDRCFGGIERSLALRLQIFAEEFLAAEAMEEGRRVGAYRKTAGRRVPPGRRKNRRAA
jgi:hypothetical protein